MEEIKEMLQELVTTKTFLKGAINEKGGTITDDTPFSEYPNQVRTKTGNLLDTLQITENGNHDVKDYKNVSVLVESDYLNIIKQILGVWGANETINVPYGVEDIMTGTFNRNTNVNGANFVKNLYLPSTLKRFYENAVEGNTTIYYESDINKWAIISKGRYTSNSYKHWNTGNISNLKIYFNNENNDIGNVTLSNTITEINIGGLSGILVNATSSNNNFILTIPKTVKTLGAGSFYGLRGFKEIKFESGSEVTFTDNGHSLFAYCHSPKLDLPIMSYVPNQCFYNNYAEEITIKEGATILEDYAFGSCKTKKVNLPSTLKTIKTSVFSTAQNMASIEIPASVESMGNQCFYGFKGNVVMQSSTPCTITSSTFSSFNNKIYVPKGSRQTFISATNWSSQASKIYEKYSIVMNIPSALLNNETITYSVDGGKTYQQFTNSVLSLDDVATIKIKSTDSTQTILVGTTSGGNDVGTISNSELTFSFTTDTQVYLTIQ